MFVAIKRSLKTISLLRDFVRRHKQTLLVVASDSNASSPALIDKIGSDPENFFVLNKKIGNRSDNLAPLDRQSSAYPFVSAPNQKGLRMPFAVVWPTQRDTGTGVLIKGEGFNADQIQGTMDNTDVYHLLRRSLFGL